MASYYRPKPPKVVPPTPRENPPNPVVPPNTEPVPIVPITVTPVVPPTPVPEPIPPALQPGNWSDAGILIHHGDGGRYFVYRRVGTQISSFVYSFADLNQDFINAVIHYIRFGTPIISHEPTNDRLAQ